MSTDRSPIQVNLGCGHIQPEGWINVDGSNRAWLASKLWWLDNMMVGMKLFPPTEFSRKTTVLNLDKPLPWKTETVDAIYAGELFEHFTPQLLGKLLDECFRVLKPGGTLRACVPDIHSFWKSYVNEVDQVLAQSPEQWNDEQPRRRVKSFFDDICVRRPFLGSMNHFHKWGFDEVQLVLEFKRRGLTQACRKSFLESNIANLNQVETREKGFLIVEGSKP